MVEKSRRRVADALLLIALGVWFLLVQLSPVVRAWAFGRGTWPLQILGLAGLFLLVGVVTFTPGWVIPASIIGGLGGLLYYQTATGDWESWAYAWTLIPGFVGVGLLLFGLLSRHQRGPLTAAAWLLGVSAVLFALFSSFLGGPAGLGQWWPVILIVLGVVILAQALVRRRAA